MASVCIFVLISLNKWFGMFAYIPDKYKTVLHFYLYIIVSWRFFYSFSFFNVHEDNLISLHSQITSLRPLLNVVN